MAQVETSILQKAVGIRDAAHYRVLGQNKEKREGRQASILRSREATLQLTFANKSRFHSPSNLQYLVMVYLGFVSVANVEERNIAKAFKYVQ